MQTVVDPGKAAVKFLKALFDDRGWCDSHSGKIFGTERILLQLKHIGMIIWLSGVLKMCVRTSAIL